MNEHHVSRLPTASLQMNRQCALRGAKTIVGLTCLVLSEFRDDLVNIFANIVIFEYNRKICRKFRRFFEWASNSSKDTYCSKRASNVTTVTVTAVT